MLEQERHRGALQSARLPPGAHCSMPPSLHAHSATGGDAHQGSPPPDRRELSDVQGQTATLAADASVRRVLSGPAGGVLPRRDVRQMQASAPSVRRCPGCALWRRPHAASLSDDMLSVMDRGATPTSLGLRYT